MKFLYFLLSLILHSSYANHPFMFECDQVSDFPTDTSLRTHLLSGPYYFSDTKVSNPFIIIIILNRNVSNSFL